MRWCSPGFRPCPTRAVGDAGPYDRVPEHRRNSGPRKAPLQGELSAEPTEGSPPHPRFPTASHTGRRGRRPLRTQPGTLPQDEIKFVPSHAAGIFHTRSVFHMTKEYFTRPQGGFHWPRQRPYVPSYQSASRALRVLPAVARLPVLLLRFSRLCRSRASSAFSCRFSWRA